MPQRKSIAAPVLVPLGTGRALEVETRSDATQLRVRCAENGAPAEHLEIEIRFTTRGPLVRVRAQSLELTAAENVIAQCRTFAVHADEQIELRSEGTLMVSAQGEAQLDARRIELAASPGAVQITANDEVQLLGEMILLNCEKPAAQPAWVERHVLAPLPLQPALPLSNESGSPDVVRELLESKP